MTVKDEDYWKSKLAPEQYRVLRQKGTEAPFTGEFLDHDEEGVYRCAACGAELFTSQAKYKSTQLGLEGWPSFAEVAKSGAVALKPDDSFGMQRIEATCANCGGHLGHVFDDTSSPTNQHYCINSVCLAFEPKSPKSSKNT